MEDTPRLTPTMRAILQCTACLDTSAPIPRPLLTAMVTAGETEANTAVNRLLKAGLLTHSGQDAVLLSEQGRDFLATRPSTERVRMTVEMALLNVVTPLVSEEGVPELAPYLTHLQTVTLAALPRADNIAEILVKALITALLYSQEFDTARTVAEQVKAQEAASGRTLLPDNLDDTFSRIDEKTIQITGGMHQLLQALACLTEDVPVPLVVITNVFEPGAEIETAVADLAALELVQQPGAGTVQITAKGRDLLDAIQPDVEESIVGAFHKVTTQAIEADNKALLEQLEPLMRRLAERVLPRVDRAAHRLVSALCQCLSHLGKHMEAIEYIDTMRLLEGTPVTFPEKEETPAEREQSLQYHAQAGVH